MNLRIYLPAFIVILAIVMWIDGRGLITLGVQQHPDCSVAVGGQDVEVIIALSRYDGRPFRVGEEIAVDIFMKNNTDKPVMACLAKDLLQTRLRLVKDGQVVPYLNGLDDVIAKQAADRGCKSLSELISLQDKDLSDEELKDPYLTEPDITELKPNRERIVSYLILFDKAELEERSDRFKWSDWYPLLQPGHYELTLERRLDCCNGPLIRSNTINFEVVPDGVPIPSPKPRPSINNPSFPVPKKKALP